MVVNLRVDGADCSHYQTDLDLVRARKAGLKWLYSKCTEGTSYRDPTYRSRREDAQKAGLSFGAYHFARFTSEADARREAKFFMETADPRPGDLCPVLDFEVEVPRGVNRAKCAVAFMEEVSAWLKAHKLAGTPIHYGPDDFGPGYKYLRWVPRYSNGNLKPKVHWDIWQFSNGQYGKPNSFAGLGRLDLNTMRAGLTLRDMRLRRMSTPAKPKTRDFRVAHASLCVFNNLSQQKSDIQKLLNRDYDWITGTEIANNELIKFLHGAGTKAGYNICHPGSQDGWIAVKHGIVVPKSWKTGWIHVLPGAKEIGDPHPYGQKGIAWCSFEVESVGQISLGVSHYLTKGRFIGQSKRDNPKCPIDHRRANMKLAAEINKWAKQAATGGNLAFYGADTNMVDTTDDVFFGGNMTTCWDELKIHPNTGHGNIDIIASFDGDARVKCKSAKVLDQHDLALFSDHYLVEAVYNVELLAK